MKFLSWTRGLASRGWEFDATVLPQMKVLSEGNYPMPTVKRIKTAVTAYRKLPQKERK
jgi:hypothetical protein